MRDSSSLTMIPELSKKGSLINYYDPSGYKNDFKKYKNVLYKKTIDTCVENADLIIIHTEWNDFKSLNFNKLMKNKKTIIYDMRNLYSPIKMKKLNIRYLSVGRSI